MSFGRVKECIVTASCEASRVIRKVPAGKSMAHPEVHDGTELVCEWVMVA